MASHLVIVHPSARTAKINTTPGKYLTDVRDEACLKFNLKPEQYTLKFNKKPISLSQQIRLANLPGGARLELVQASRSPTVISVALQLPEPEKSIRLTQKFANNVSVWEILRYFESASGANHNFTQRGVPQMSNGAAGAGRLNYETPVITVMPGHRELSSFVELQQTLNLLGFDSGTALLRLNFKNSGTPLEEAMAEISTYFKGGEETATSTSVANGADAEMTETSPSVPIPQEEAPEVADSAPVTGAQNEVSEPMETYETETPQPIEAISQDVYPKPVTSSSSEPFQPSSSGTIKIFAPPSSSTPQAARTAFNEADYVPTIEHARGHLATLSTKGKNTRLLSDKELAEKEATQKLKYDAAAQKGVTFRIRMPDESQVMMTFSNSDTASTLYDAVRNLIEHPTEAFSLRYMGTKGAPIAMKSGPQRLIQDLRFSGREILTFLWDENASNEARLSKQVLKQEWRQKAQVLRVEEPEVDNMPEEKGSTNVLGKKAGGANYSNADKESKLKSILGKGLFKR